MDMTPDQPSPIRRFFRTWRREIVRGGVLFSLVIGVGLVVSRVRASADDSWAALRSFGEFAMDGDNLFGGGREVGDPWQYRGPLKASQQLWIRNVNGPVNVVRGTANEVVVLAEKSWRRSSPSRVEIIAVPSEDGVTICALWDGRERHCGASGDYQVHGVRHNDVAVRFTVQLPPGVRLDASTVSGHVDVDGASAPVTVETVTGRIAVRSTAGSVTAETVTGRINVRGTGPVKATAITGSIEATVARPGAEVELETVTGSITSWLPDKLNADLEAETVNGRVDTEFPVQLSGKISPRNVRGTIGTGGHVLKLNTVNGSIHIRRGSPPEGGVEGGVPRAPRSPRPPPAVTRVEQTPTP